MKKRTITQEMLDELAKSLPVIPKEECHRYIGGGIGTEWDPCTMSEFDTTYSQSGNWDGFVTNETGLYRVQISEEVLDLDFSTGNITGSVADSDPTFYGYRRSDPTGCFRRCAKMLSSVGVTPYGPEGNIYLADPTKDGRAGASSMSFEDAVAYIERELGANRPVIVGVDYKDGSPNRDGMTDHFVLIVGHAGSNGYRFYDPATSHPSDGTNASNTLVIRKDQITGQYKKRNYIVTLVRRNH